MLSNTCKAAIKAVIYLAIKSRLDEKASISEVAKNINGSVHTVGKILQTLARHGIINSTKGPSGGFFINGTQQNQTIIDIVAAMGEQEVFNVCGLGLSECLDEHPCPIHNDYKLARDMIENIFSETKVDDLCDPVSNGLTYLIG